jgi:transcriptional regulator with XRE-family HTH domain
MMAGIKKELGPTGRRVAEAIRRFRRGENQDITTAELSRRLTALGQPIPDTGITKTEKGDRRVDVDDLAAIALALGVTPNTLMLPQVDYLGGQDFHWLTPAARGGAEKLWQWAQGEKPLYTSVPGASSWLGSEDYPALRFSIRCRPYLTALHSPGPGGPPDGTSPDPLLRDLCAAVLAAMKGGVTATQVRRAVELTITLPAVLSAEQADRWVADGTRPEGI